MEPKWFYPIFAAVLGKDSETVLIPMDDSSLAVREYTKVRGMGYAGMFTLFPREQKATVACLPGMEEVMKYAVPKFAEHVKTVLTERILALPPDTAPLERLWSLPDTRTVN